MAHQEINFSPYNALDFVDRKDLVTPNGDEVRITLDMYMKFRIMIGGNPPICTYYNSQASYILNSAQVGITYRGVE